MNITYRLEGLCCASCADKIQNEVGNLDGVHTAKVSFITTKMRIEADESKLAMIEKQAKKIVKRIEPDVVIVKN